MGNLVFDDAILQHDGRATAIGRVEQRRRVFGAITLIDRHFLLWIILGIFQFDLQHDTADAAGGVDMVNSGLRAIDEAVTQNLGYGPVRPAAWRTMIVSSS